MPDVAERLTIELPREEGESARAYAARVEYILAGPGRSLGKLRGQSGGKAGVPQRLSTLEEWSSRYGWSEHARRYDDMVIQLRTQEAAEQYRKDLEDHRLRYQKAGRELFQVAQGLQAAIARSLKGQTIEGKDGKVYTIPSMRLDQGAITVLARTLTIAADLEAHALRLGDILPKLDHDIHDS